MDTNSEILCHLYDIEKERLHQSWKNFILESDPRLYITIKFLPPTIQLAGSGYSARESRRSQATKSIITDAKAIRWTNELLKRINQRLHGRSGKHLDGYGCLEYQKSEQPHFHFLLINDIESDRFKEVTKHVINSARRHGKPLPFIDTKSVDVQQVYDAEGNTDYVTKLFEFLDSGERMLLLDQSQILD